MNIFTFSGNMARDIDVAYTPNGKCIGTLAVPVKQGWGEHEKTSWIECKILGDRADKLKFLTKGTKVWISGEYVFESWDKKDGSKGSKSVCIVREIEFPAKEGGQSAHTPTPQKTIAQKEVEGSFDDDIPF